MITIVIKVAVFITLLILLHAVIHLVGIRQLGPQIQPIIQAKVSIIVSRPLFQDHLFCGVIKYLKSRNTIK